MNTFAAKSILKEGTLVSTKLGNCNAWYNNIIYKIDEDQMVMSLIDSYLENTIMINSHLDVKYSNEFFEYIFEGTVVAIEPKSPRSITILIKRAEELVNTRSFPRYDTYIASTVKLLWEDTLHFSIVNNICLGGMAFVCKRELDYGEEANVCIYIPDFEVICSRGKIIRKTRKNNIFNYSMQFVDMDEANSIRISDYLASIDGINSELKEAFEKNVKEKVIYT